MYLKKCLIAANSRTTVIMSQRFTSCMSQVWSLEKMLPIQTLQRHNDSVNTLMVNGDLLLTGSEDTEIKVCYGAVPLAI